MSISPESINNLDKLTVGKNILRNTTALYAAEIIAKASMFFLTILIARQLGSRQFGKLSFGIALVSIIALVGDLGISLLITKEVAKDKSSAGTYFSSGMVAKLILSIIVIGIVFGYAELAELAADTRYVLMILALAYALNTISLLFVALIRAFQKMHLEGFIRIFQSLLNLTIGALLLFSGYNIVALAASILAANLASLLLFWAANRRFRFADFKLRIINWSVMNKLIKSALPFAALSVFITLYFKIDIVLLEQLSGPQQVGEYTAAYKLIEAVIIISWVFSRVLLPVLSDMIRNTAKALPSVTQTAFRFFITLALPVAAAVTLLAPEIIKFVYGNSYQPAVKALQILIWAIVPIFISSTTIAIIMAGKKPQIAAYIALIQLILNIGLNLLLIPGYGINGAAAATVVTESTNVFLHHVYIKRNIYAIKLYSLFPKPLLGTAVMVLIIFYHQALILLPLYGLVYLSVLWLVKGIGMADISLFRKLVIEGK